MHAPLVVRGRLKGGRAEIDGMDSQPVSALLIASALAQAPTELTVRNPGERPWVGVTLDWLDRCGVEYSNDDFRLYRVRGHSRWGGFETTVPLDWSAAWTLAGLLDGIGMHDAAQQWYRHAITASRAVGEERMPPEFLAARAGSLYWAGKYEQSLKFASEALKKFPDSVDLTRIVILSLEKLQRADQALQYLKKIEPLYEKAINAAQDGSEKQRLLNQRAWFFAYEHPDKTKALSYADAAVAHYEKIRKSRAKQFGFSDQTEQPGETAGESQTTAAQSSKFDPIYDMLYRGAKRARGFALLLNGKYEQAREVFDELTAESLKTEGFDYRDQWAMLGKARIMLAADNVEQVKTQVLELLTEAANVMPVGQAFREISAAIVKLGGEKPAPLDTSVVTTMLQKYDDNLLRFHEDPATWLSLRLQPTADRVGFDQPIYLRCAVLNKGSFNITLGPRSMLNPVINLSVRAVGVRAFRFAPYTAVNLQSSELLEPGGALGRRIDGRVGKLWSMLRVRPQVPFRITFTAELFPPRGYTGEKGLTVQSTEVLRDGVRPTTKVLTRLMKRLQRGSDTDRIQVARLLAALVAEQQYSAAGKLEYRPQPVDTGPLKRALLAALEDRDWRVRAWTAEPFGSSSWTSEAPP